MKLHAVQKLKELPESDLSIYEAQTCSTMASLLQLRYKSYYDGMKGTVKRLPAKTGIKEILPS